MKGNFVAKSMHKSCVSSVVPDKRRLKQSEATLRDADQIISEGLFYSETMCFDDGGNDGCDGCLNDLGCSSVSIDCEED